MWELVYPTALQGATPQQLPCGLLTRQGERETPLVPRERYTLEMNVGNEHLWADLRTSHTESVFAHVLCWHGRCTTASTATHLHELQHKYFDKQLVDVRRNIHYKNLDVFTFVNSIKCVRNTAPCHFLSVLCTIGLRFCWKTTILCH